MTMQLPTETEDHSGTTTWRMANHLAAATILACLTDVALINAGSVSHGSL